MDSRVVGVAVHEDAAAQLEEALGSCPEIAQDVRVVTIGSEGQVTSGAATGTEVLWRQGWVTRDWLLSAIAQLPDLRWLHSDSVGVDTLPLDEIAFRGVTLTNAAGVYSRPIAEWVVLAILAAAKRLPDFVRRSDAAIWTSGPELQELMGSVVLLLGLGSINALVAAMLSVFGVEVSAMARRPRTDRPIGVDRIIEREELHAELCRADYVVLGLPLTPETEHVIDAEALRHMKQGAWLINVARGRLIDEEALVASLDNEQVGGAILDAFDEEPLPANHPLWRRENVVVIPHFTWSSPAIIQRRRELFLGQLMHWLGQRPLLNLVDPAAGY